jgi:hypothetical protein
MGTVATRSARSACLPWKRITSQLKRSSRMFKFKNEDLLEIITMCNELISYGVNTINEIPTDELRDMASELLERREKEQEKKIE